MAGTEIIPLMCPELPRRFTYPFCYEPHPLVRKAADALIARLDADPAAAAPFREGKMLGVLIAAAPESEGLITLYGFSGLAGGKSHIDGFVPPVFDTENLTPARSGDDSRTIQNRLFEEYRVMNGLGQEASVKEIFAQRGLVPPGGTGDCAGPKLLNHAFRTGLRPLAMGEFWYGDSPASQVRTQGSFYPSCTGKCGPLLTWMMQGLEVDPNPLDIGFPLDRGPRVIFEVDAVIVVDKPAGMLSVPGRVAAKSLLEWLRERYGSEVESCHRLDMDTSGVMVFARNTEAKAALEAQFAAREVCKTYRARLSANPVPAAQRSRDLRKGAQGTIALPLMLDYYDRPRQMVDDTDGKPSVTRYEVLDVLPDGEIEIVFTPLTGRTHQLRVHAAHIRGLGRPIKGDRLYGGTPAPRLFLHAATISFRHPLTGATLTFSSPVNGQEGL